MSLLTVIAAQRAEHGISIAAAHRPEGRMSPPDQMIYRWQNRPEPAPGEGVVSWHMLMRDYPEVLDLARQVQQRLAGFDVRWPRLCGIAAIGWARADCQCITSRS